MATMKKTTTASKPKEEEAVVEVNEEVEKKVVEKKKKTYKDSDPVRCKSITAGEYLFVGDKTKIVYSWVTNGDEVDMEYADLISAIRTKKPCIYKPRVVIMDDDILADYPELQELYDSLYSKDDLREILKLSPSKMRAVVNNLPDGARDSLKTIAITAIDNGELDSIKTVKAIDEIFGTDMLLRLAQ